MIGFTDLSVTDTQVVFQVIRQRSRDSIYEDFVKKLKSLLVGQISFDMKMVNENHEVLTASVDLLLKNSYENYKKAVGTMLEHEIQTTLEAMNDYRLLLRIRPALKRCMVGKTSASKKIEIIATDSGVTIEEVKRLLQNNIRKLLTMELDLDALKTKVK